METRLKKMTLLKVGLFREGDQHGGRRRKEEGE
jgi:hypothetical protein